MTREELFEAVGQAPDDDLAHSDGRGRRSPWMGAAALACAAALALAFLPKGEPVSPGTPDPLPLLPNVGPTAGAGGSYALMAYDLSELYPDSPGRDVDVPETLPVWDHPTHTSSGTPWGLAEEEMAARMEKAAQALGVKIVDVGEERAGVYGDPDVPEGTLVRLEGQTDGGLTVTSYGNGTIEVIFAPSVALPEGYSFTFSDTGPDQAGETLAYLAERYAALLDFEEPRAAVSVDYTFDGRPITWYSLYDAAGDVAEDLVNYSLRTASFSPDSDGGLWIIRIHDETLVGEKLGDYPLRTEEEARRALLSGDYHSMEPEPFPGEEALRGVELIYSNGADDPVWMPYYRFWAEIPPLTDKVPEGLKTYASYYVPAVRPEYLTDVDTQMGNNG